MSAASTSLRLLHGGLQRLDFLSRANLSSRELYLDWALDTDEGKLRACLRFVADDHERHALEIRSVIGAGMEELANPVSRCRNVAAVWPDPGIFEQEQALSVIDKAICVEDYLKSFYSDALGAFRGLAIRQLISEQMQEIAEAAVQLRHFRRSGVLSHQ